MTILTLTKNDLDKDGNIKKGLLVGHISAIDINIPDLTKLPNNFPVGLYTLDLSGCINIAKLPNNLPTSITTLDLSGTGIAELTDNLPDNIRILNLSETKIKELPQKLPKNLRALILNNNNLEDLDNLTENLVTLELEGCDKLTNLPDEKLTNLIIDLEKLTSNGCKITYPQSFPEDKITKFAEEKLKKIEGVHGFTSSTVKLFKRYIYDDHQSRGGASSLALNVIEVLDIVEKNSDNLKWIEEIASNYLDGCVNQPVAGFFEIANWLAVGEKSKLDKVSALDPLIAHKAIINFAIEQQKVGKGYDAEFSNALFRAVHEKLWENKDIDSRWFGVPTKIANEGIVKEHLTEEIINAAYEVVKTLLKQSPSEKIDFLFIDDKNLNILGNIFFSDEVGAIKTKYAEPQNPLGELFLLHDLAAQKSTEIKIEIEKLEKELVKINYEIPNQAKEIFNKITFAPDSLKEALEMISKGLKTKEQLEISGKVKTLINEFIEKHNTPATITKRPSFATLATRAQTPELS